MSNQQAVGVVVVGSANMDILFNVRRMPKPGETLLADHAAFHPGGKGLNQAVASARAGAATAMIAALGNDTFGATLADVMASAGIRGDLVRRTDSHTGQAFIVVDQTAENMIVVASGANAAMTRLTEVEARIVAEAQVLLMQLELPVGIVLEAAHQAKEAGRAVMLNAAPAATLPAELLDLLDYLIVNEHEACLIAGTDDLAAASAALAARVDRLIVTLGAAGCVAYEHGEKVGSVHPPASRPVDTTGAGDTFCGAFAAATAEGQGLMGSLRFATAAAALSVETVGAVPSIPSRSSILDKLEENW